MQAGDSDRQDDVGAGGLDGKIPAIAGDVPVEFVVVLEEAQAIANAIVQRDISRGVLGGGNKDLQLEIFGAALLFDAKRGAIGVRGADIDEEMRIIATAETGLFYRNIAFVSLSISIQSNLVGCWFT